MIGEQCTVCMWQRPKKFLLFTQALACTLITDAVDSARRRSCSDARTFTVLPDPDMIVTHTDKDTCIFKQDYVSVDSFPM